MRSSGTMLILSLVVFTFISGTMIYKCAIMDQQCTGFLKRSADSNKISRAITELETAIKYLENNGMTSGYTSVIYRTPDEDVGFWYNNLKESLENLKKIDVTQISQLEESNVLMKLRETLLDASKDGTSITCPAGISRFPNNALYGLTFWVSLIMSGIFLVAVAHSEF